MIVLLSIIVFRLSLNMDIYIVYKYSNDSTSVYKSAEGRLGSEMEIVLLKCPW